MFSLVWLNFSKAFSCWLLENIEDPLDRISLTVLGTGLLWSFRMTWERTHVYTWPTLSFKRCVVVFSRPFDSFSFLSFHFIILFFYIYSLCIYSYIYLTHSCLSKLIYIHTSDSLPKWFVAPFARYKILILLPLTDLCYCLPLYTFLTLYFTTLSTFHFSATHQCPQ